jgi:hypothetical protein
MLFKGPGSFKKFFKIGGNVDELKAYRLIPLTPPLFFHFTLPLMCGKLAMTCSEYQVYLYGSQAITYLNDILWVLYRASTESHQTAPTPY